MRMMPAGYHLDIRKNFEEKGFYPKKRRSQKKGLVDVHSGHAITAL